MSICKVVWFKVSGPFDSFNFNRLHAFLLFCSHFLPAKHTRMMEYSDTPLVVLSATILQLGVLGLWQLWSWKAILTSFQQMEWSLEQGTPHSLHPLLKRWLKVMSTLNLQPAPTNQLQQSARQPTVSPTTPIRHIMTVLTKFPAHSRMREHARSFQPFPLFISSSETALSTQPVSLP